MEIEIYKLETKKLGELSNEINTALAVLFNGGQVDWRRLLSRALAAGPIGCWNYLYYSRLRQRVAARLKAFLTWRLASRKTKNLGEKSGV